MKGRCQILRRILSADLCVREGAQPIFCRARPLPYALKARVDRELDAMLAAGVVEPVTRSDWATPLVVVNKADGGLRICADYKLLRKGKHWRWGVEQNLAFEKVKTLLCSTEALVHFDMEQESVLTVDASARGLGAVLSQRGAGGAERVVAYASRSLGPHEIHYSQIHKEALAIVFAVDKFHQYLFGRKFLLRTDHKPLVSIFGPNIGIPSAAASRLQRWAIKLSAYDFTIEYVKTDKNTADVLSRLINSQKEVVASENNDLPEQTYLHFSTDALLLDYNVLKKETRGDPILSRVLSYIVDGWPVEIDIKELKPYFNRRTELYTELGCIMWGHRVVIPTACRAKVMTELHDPHMGIVKTKSLARSYVWWPGVDEAVEAACRQCAVSAAVADAPPGHAPRSWPWPSRPWSRLHLDFLGPIEGLTYLVVVDSCSKWIEAIRMKRTTAQAVITVLRDIWAKFGLPKQTVSDNGPPFSSVEFQQFLSHNGIEHIFSSPYHPASNGAAENAVKICKRAIKKALKQKLDVDVALNRFLLAYRNTEHETTGDSPASILQGRNLRMRLDNLKPDREARVATRQARSESLAGGAQRQLDVGAPVWYRGYRSVDKWVAGTIVDKLGNTDYRVRSIFGTEIHRHIDQLRLRFTGTVEGTSSDRQASVDLRQVEKTRCSRKSLTFPIASGEETEGDVSAAPGSPPVEVATSPQTSSSYQPNVPENIEELVLRMEDCRSKERRLEELKHNLEVCLADATQQIQELKARLGGSEGRCRALEASLAQLEAGKRDVEAKLSSIAHTLRRICGVHPDGSVQAAARRRLASPARRYSPHRGRDHSEDRNDIIDVDPDLIKKGVRNLMHEVCQIEREKDDYKSQLAEFKKQLKEQQGKGDNKIQSVTASLRNVQEEKARLQSAVAAKDAQINALNESVQTKSVEISTIRDKVTSLEASLTTISEEKLQFENKAESLRIQLSERIQEATELRTALQSSEQRCARLDVRRASLEGDLQRARQLQGERARQLQVRSVCERGRTTSLAGGKPAESEAAAGRASEADAARQNNEPRWRETCRERGSCRASERGRCRCVVCVSEAEQRASLEGDLQRARQLQGERARQMQVRSVCERGRTTSLAGGRPAESEAAAGRASEADAARQNNEPRWRETCRERGSCRASERGRCRCVVCVSEAEQRASLEGDLQRARQLQGERARQMQQLQERCDQAAKAIASLEDRCTSLKGTVEQLSTSLQKAATAESDLRSEVNRLTRQLTEAKNNENNAVDKLRQLQKSVTNCENEKRVYSEKLESAKTALSELKRLNATLEDQVHRLTNQLANVEVQRSGLESQLRMTTWDGKESVDSELERELHAMQRERSELKAKCDALQDTVRKMEAERRMNCTTIRSKSHDRTEKSVYYSDIDSAQAAQSILDFQKRAPASAVLYVGISRWDGLQDTVRKMEAERRMNCTTIRSKSQD
ncbi:unnamed protein product [Plutella xylostella]|uniref:RNA-directed DNA polymerase n=1 Tax=Plutella xylostella TaxID=51655 RepID=A0A8S4EZD1_PLUXY|nr:unnamed protein product [Plutella xylostella]